MTFLVIFIALLVERFFDWSNIRRWNWLTAYAHVISQRFSQLPSFVILLIVILPGIIVVGLVEYFLRGWLYGFLDFLYQLCFFIYCLGPQNLWADTLHSSSHDHNATSETDASLSLTEQSTNNIFVAANQRLFAVLFWYFIFGPIGAFLYRG